MGGYFKLYNELWLDDEKINSLSLEEQGAFVRVMALASKDMSNGKLAFDYGKFPRLQSQILAFGIPETCFQKLIFIGLVFKDENGFYTVKNWKKYQPEYDRQKQYRKKLQQKVTTESYNEKLQPEVTSEDVDVDVRFKNIKDEKKKTGPPSSGVLGFKEFGEWWSNEWQQRFGSKYPYNGAKDGTAVKKMLKDYTFEKLKEFAVLGWECRDEWIRKQCATIAGFSAQIPKIIVSVPPKQKSKFDGIQGGLDA